MIDSSGIFYIIHPLEMFYRKDRDQYSGIFNNPNINKMKPFTKFFNHLFTLRLITYDPLNNEFIKTKIYSIYDELKENIKEIIPIEQTNNYNKLISMILGARYGKLNEILFIYNIIENSSIGGLSRKSTSRSGATYPDSSLLIEKFGNSSSDIQVYLNIFNKLKLLLPSFDNINPNDLLVEFNKSKNNILTFLLPEDIQVFKNYEKRNLDKIKKISIFKNTNTDNKKIELWCNQYGLDPSEIDKLLNQFYKDYRVSIFVNEWVQKYIKYIPYFQNIANSPNVLEFILISSYVNLGISNIDDQQDYKKAIKDSNSLVTGTKIMGFKKETIEKGVKILHLVRFDPIYVPAIVPALIYYLENKSFLWETKNYYYKNVTSDMIEKYLIPEPVQLSSKNNEEIRKIKIYNNKLLSIFRLLRS
jgi:hypothetical protein